MNLAAVVRAVPTLRRMAGAAVVVAAAWTPLQGPGEAREAVAQEVARETAAQSAVVSPPEAQRWREDLAQFRHFLLQTHGDPFHTISEEHFDEMVDALDRDIPTLPRHRIIVELQRIAAAIGDGHTTVALFFDPDVGFHRLPIRLEWFEEGLFAIWAHEAAGVPAGARVTGIGEASMEDAIRRVTPLISRDNDIWIRTMAPLLLSSPEVLHALGLSNDPNGAHLAFEHAGRTNRVYLAAEPEPFVISHGGGDGRPIAWSDARPASADTALARRNSGRVYWYEYDPGTELLYIQYNMVNNAPHGPGVHEFFAEALGILDSAAVQRLVLDLRANGGGEGSLNRGVVRQFIRRPELQHPGSLFVLIGRQTFSAAQELAHMLDQWTPAIFVGEPTGSSPQFWGDHRWTELGHSGIQVSASPTWWQPGGPYDRRPFLPPLLAFEPRFDDYVSGRDAALEAVIDWDRFAGGLDASLVAAIAAGDTGAAVAAVEAWSADPIHRYRTATTELNRLGYQLLEEHRTDAAIAVFELNVTVHPDYANGWDSLGDALLRAGRREEGLAAYRTAYGLDPTVGTAARVLGLTTDH